MIWVVLKSGSGYCGQCSVSVPDDEVTVALRCPELVGGDQRVLAHVVLPRGAEDEGAHLAGVVNLGLLEPALACTQSQR